MAYKPFQMPTDIWEYLAALRDERKARQVAGQRVTLISVLREELNLPDPQDTDAEREELEQVHP
jgi:DNA-binding transcriptional regulator GbsR (MarR family)